jgi:G3E family GTPase
MKTTRLILVGGFLGAGKTTLLWEAARSMKKKNLNIGLITNDQAPELVDTALLTRDQVNVAEVNGSCFCCNFSGLIDAMEKLKKDNAIDIIIAEPVGSCTDLSATILQPLKQNMQRELVVSPLTVLADPIRLADILNEGNAGLHPKAAYILMKQLEECDIILISKTDSLTSAELERLKEKAAINYPDSEIRSISSVTGEGLEGWINEVLTRNDSGNHLAEIDYDIYAEGEALMGWLNCTIELSGHQVDWNKFAREFLGKLSRHFDNMNASVGHVKLILESGTGFLTGNLTGRSETLNFRNQAGHDQHAKLTFNARVEMSPEVLETIVKEIFHSMIGKNITYQFKTLKSLSPGRPVPTFRFDHVVARKKN